MVYWHISVYFIDWFFHHSLMRNSLLIYRAQNMFAKPRPRQRSLWPENRWWWLHLPPSGRFHRQPPLLIAIIWAPHTTSPRRHLKSWNGVDSGRRAGPARVPISTLSRPFRASAWGLNLACETCVLLMKNWKTLCLSSIAVFTFYFCI